MIEQGMIKPFQYEQQLQQDLASEEEEEQQQQHQQPQQQQQHDIDFTNQQQQQTLTQVVHLSSPLDEQPQHIAKQQLLQSMAPQQSILSLQQQHQQQQQQQQIVQLQPRPSQHALPSTTNRSNSGSVTIFVIKTVLPDE